MMTGTTLLQAAAPGGGLMGFLPMILIIVAFCFFMKMILTLFKRR